MSAKTYVSTIESTTSKKPNVSVMRLKEKSLPAVQIEEGQGSRPLAPRLPETTFASDSRKKSSHLHCILIKHD
jgi:hypothetical protein